MKSTQIKNGALALALALAMAACTGATDPSASPASDDAPGSAAATGQSGQSDLLPVAAGPAAAVARRSIAGGFASLPDRGDLVAYPDKPVVRQEGAHAWHRADVSEAHALRAIAEGVLTLTAPSGERLRFQYDRHVEHESGDWTWIGHLVGGTQAQDAILTFGQASAFGTIAQQGKPALHLDMRDQASWLVETDPVALAAQAAKQGKPESDEVAPSPDLRIHGLAGAVERVRASRAPVLGALAEGTVTIDLLVGYTDGFADEFTLPNGNATPVFTRLNHFVSVTNESFVNSLVDAEVRMVHTLQVSYIDNNDSSVALEALAGVADGWVGPDLADPALKPLHVAREEYSADLVSLVRLRKVEQGNVCGIAYNSLSGKRAPGPNDDYFGFSVVSSGYPCGETTFAHELGHNLGLTHDIDTVKESDGVLDDPDDYGGFDYSFGYRTGPGQGDFTTVMAYNSGQANHYRVFSNPDIDFCGGFACGIPNQSDNARALRQTVGVIAGYRSVGGGIAAWTRGDIDGDGMADLFWRNGGTGQNVLWLGADAKQPLTLGSVAMAWHVAGVGDFDGDLVGDVLWRNNATGQNTIWLGGDRNSAMVVASLVGEGWTLAGVGDFDGDGVSDLFWRNTSTGQNVAWRSADASTSLVLANVGAAWQVAGIGDFNGDGADDALWRNTTSGQNVIWHSANSGTAASVRGVGSEWTAVGIADFDGDGSDDVLWRQLANGRNVAWRSADPTTPLAVQGVPGAWLLVAAGDFDGDGNADLVWRHGTNGANRLWKSADAASSQVLQGVPGNAWQVQP